MDNQVTVPISRGILNTTILKYIDKVSRDRRVSECYKLLLGHREICSHHNIEVIIGLGNLSLRGNNKRHTV